MYSRILVVAVAFVVLGGVFVSPVAGSTTVEDADEPMLHVDVAADGDATVSLVSVYDLDDEDEQAAFESLEQDEEVQDELRDRFADRMESVAENSGHGEVAVIGDGSVDIRSEDGYGIMILSVTWDSFAEVEGDMLVVTEPFASGFESDRQLVVTGPDNSTIDSTAHDPASEDGVQASWDAGTDLDGFELVIALEDGEEKTVEETEGGGEDASDGSPGFGVGAALVVLVAVLGIASNRIQS